MFSLLRSDRSLWLSVTMLGAIACQVPGEDWVAPSDGSTSSAADNTVASAVTSGGPATVSSTTDATSGGDVTTDTSGGSGGSTSSTSDGGATGDATTETTTDATSETSSDTSSDTTGSSGTGGVDPDSLVDNGDFAAGEEGWEIEGDASVDVSSGEYCITLNSAGTVYLDWPTEFDPASVANGVSYVFSYIVYYSGEAPTVSVKIGQPVEPYNAFADGEIDVSNSPETFMHTFTMEADDQAGIRFTVDGPSGTEVCFDNVALVAQ